MLTAACASTGGVPHPFPTPAGPAPAPAAAAPTPAPAPIARAPAPGAPEADDDTLISTALSLRGTPYRNGGSDPTGFDCSGFTQYVFARHGIRLPREVHDQFTVGRKIRGKDLTTGDLVFFHTVARGASHVGIVIGDDEFIHAPSSAGVVRIEHLSSSYWSRRFIAGRRINSSVRSAARRRPSGEESAAAGARAARSGARDSRVSD
jgi:peptidoglycan DL-endopeptidase CwlO